MILRNPLSRDLAAERADPDVILVGPDAERKRRAGARWGLALVVYMRALAVMWMAFGVSRWGHILDPGPLGLENMPFDHAVAVAVFAVADLVAAVGLWLIAPWGGALWLATVAGEIMVGALVGGPMRMGALATFGHAAAIILYVVLTWFAARERENP
jgi:hypothetical protein